MGRDLGDNTTTLQQMKQLLPAVLLPLYSIGCHGTLGVSCLDDVVPPESGCVDVSVRVCGCCVADSLISSVRIW